jgi:hypothetical protein
MKSANGDIYEGYFQNNLMNGHGALRFVNGNIYEGSW